jgi:hypothetical protein
MELTAFNQSFESFPGIQITNSGFEPNNMAHFMVGQVVKLACKASLGTYSFGEILWRKSEVKAGIGINKLSSYYPNQEDFIQGEVLANGCLFYKTDSFLYNITDEDATRTASNPLQFQCYVDVPYLIYDHDSTTQNFYIQACKFL